VAFLSEESPDAIFVTTVYTTVVRKRKEPIMRKFIREPAKILFIYLSESTVTDFRYNQDAMAVFMD